MLGGDHGDLPLEAASGQLIADLVVEERLSVVLDLSLLRKGQQVQFMTDFAEQLYHRNRAPVHLVLDEADAFGPQRPMKGQERMLGAMEDLVRRGRARGLGVSLVTQRAAVLKKDLLTQVEVLVTLRTITPQDRAAIDEWIRVHGTPEQREQLMASLPRLPIGTAWFWSPGWLNIFQQVRVRRRETFDSSATPEVGRQVQTPERLADVDLAALRGRLAATIEKAKADDPRELRRRIADLERQLAQRPAAEPRVEVRTEVQTIEVLLLRQEQLDAVASVATTAAETAARLSDVAERLLEAAGQLRQPITATPAPAAQPMRRDLPRQPVPRIEPVPRAHRRPPPHSPAPRPEQPVESGISTPQQRILDALGSLAAVRLDAPHRATVAAMAGFHVGGHFNNTLGNLRTRGLVHYPGPNEVSLTDDGRSRVHAPFEITSVAELHQAWFRLLSGPQRRILAVLIAAYPAALAREDLAQQAGFAVGGHFNNTLGSLRTMGIVDYPGPNEAAATALLFPPLSRGRPH